jgi:adenylate kinase
VRKYVIMGVQGSGKGTQAKLLADDLDLVHMSVGDIFRWNVQNHTKLGAQVRRTVASGHLVGDDLVESVVRERLSSHDWNYGFIIDGFPRNARQAEFFLESYDIDGVIYLDLPDEEVVRRVLARRLCSQCGLDYNLIAHRPRREDTCDVCGGALVTRADDNPEALAVRLRDYHEKTKPVMDIFQRKEYIATVDARRDRLAVQAEIRKLLNLPPLPSHPDGAGPTTPAAAVGSASGATDSGATDSGAPATGAPASRAPAAGVPATAEPVGAHEVRG